MSFNFQENYDTIIFDNNKVQFCRKQLKRTNFRNKYENEELDAGIMINFPYESTYFSFKCPSTEIPLTDRYERAGVIPYTVIDDEKWFCLGVDSQHGTLTDFGGSVKKYETFAAAAVRELYEETLGVFKFSPHMIYNHTISIYDKNMIIMFAQVATSSISAITTQFHKLYSKVRRCENSNIMWIREDILCNLIHTGKSINVENCNYPMIYKPVADLLRTACTSNGLI